MNNEEIENKGIVREIECPQCKQKIILENFCESLGEVPFMTKIYCGFCGNWLSICWDIKNVELLINVKEK